MSRPLGTGSPDFKERAALVADAIESMLFYYPFPEPFAHTVFDLLRLLELGKGCVTLWDHRHNSCAWVTLSPQERRFRGMPMSWLEGLSPPPKGFKLNNDLEIILESDGGSLAPVVRDVFSHFVDHGTDKEVVALLTAFADQRQSVPVVDWPESIPAPVDHDPAKWSEKMRGPLSSIMARVAAWDSVLSLPNITKLGARPVDAPDSDAPLNIFAVTTWRLPAGQVRTISNPDTDAQVEYPFTGRILLTTAQQSWIRSLPSEVWDGVADPVRAIEARIGLNSRFISDGALDSGNLEVGQDVHAARHDAMALDRAQSGDDELRHSVESTLYGLFPGKRVLLSIPVHVGGSPWLTLYSLVNPNDWREVFHLYRQVIPILGQRLRREARETYLACLEEAIRSELRDNASRWDVGALARINAAWMSAGLAFPFPVPGIEEAESKVPSGDLFPVGGKYYRIVEKNERGFFRSTVEFGMASPQDLAARCRQIVGSINVDRIVKLDAVTTFGHELKNTLRESSFQHIRGELARPQNEWNRNLIHKAIHNLGHLFWAQGLVSLLCEFAQQTIPSETTQQKSTDWEASVASFRWNTAVLEEYRNTLGNIVRHFASFYQSPEGSVAIRCLDVSEYFESLGAIDIQSAWNRAAPADLELRGNPLNMLWFPPVPENEAWRNLRIAIATLLTEPIRNAFKAARPSTDRPVSHPLVMYSARLDGDQVLIDILNTTLSASRGRPDRSSLDFVNSLAAALGVGSVSQLDERRLADGTLLMVTRVMIHPQHFDPSKGI